MKIKKLRICNFRNLELFDIEFDEKLTVLVANNSSGKTSILDAISIVLGSYVGGFPTEKNNGFKFTDAIIKKSGDEPKYPVSVESDIVLDNSISVYRELSSKGSKTTTKHSKELEEYAKKNYIKLSNKEIVDLPVIAYYGTGRLYRETRHSKKKREKEKLPRSYGYRNCLNPNSNFKEFREWFIEQTQIKMNALLKNMQKNSNLNADQLRTSGLLTNIQKSIDSVLRHLDWKNLHFNGEDLVIENYEEVELSIESLSDGVKNILTLVADIAYRCFKLNPHLDDPSKQTKGIVLIDEIEMHLHPSWQQRIIIDLQNTFNNIQFIITTHSPQVLSGVKNENIRIIKPTENEAIVPIVNPYGKQSIIALEDIMNVSSRPPKEVIKEVGKLEEYLDLVQKGDLDNPLLEELRTELDDIYGANYKKLLIADMIINKFKAKQK